MNKEELEKIVYCLFTNGKYVYDAKEYTEILDNIFVAKWYDTIEDENGNIVYEMKQPVTPQMQTDIDRKNEVIRLFNGINVKTYEMNEPTKRGTCSGYGKAILEDADKIKSLLTAMIDGIQPQLFNISKDMQELFDKSEEEAKRWVREMVNQRKHGKQIMDGFVKWYEAHHSIAKGTTARNEAILSIDGIYGNIEGFYNDLVKVPLNVGKSVETFRKLE